MSSLKFSIKCVGVLSVLAVSSSAMAARYLVVLKDAKTFQQVHSQVSLSNHTQLGSLSAFRNSANSEASIAGSSAVVEDSLENLQTIVVNTDDEAALQSLKASGVALVVEKEFFHPTPRPVNGYALTKPWNFSLTYARNYVPGSVQTQGNNGYLPGTGPKTPWGILAVNAPQAWAKSNFGSGARVAVIDTGIDKDHPAVAGNFEQGKDFIGDGNTPYEFADKVGHGTHVSGTMAGLQAADGFTGVAPQAKILTARVCNEQGCSNIAVAAGINWAISQKVDVISMSLGGAVGTPAEQSAVKKADSAGIVVVAASGNDGTAQVGFPAAYPSVIAVGAVDVNLAKADFSQWGPELAVMAPGVDVVSSVPLGTGRESQVIVTLSGAQKTVPSSAMKGSPDVPNTLSAELVFAGLGQPDDFKDLDLTGKIALVQRGTIKFGDKVKNAIAANAVGVIIYNNTTGLIAGSLTDDDSIVAIPAVGIEKSVGEQLAQELSSKQKVTGSLQTIATDYSSYSGTSMATPHVAGVSLLVRAANKNLKGKDVKALLKATAHALQPNDQNQTGSGMVDAEAAVNSALN